MTDVGPPPPLTPADCDLRAYPWFPFHYRRLRQSAFWKRASDAACRISVDLWAEAYEQVPAGSLPDDDHTLADWAGFGRRNLAGWLDIKEEVLSAWVKCSDGRWYHPTLCEVACEAWAKHRDHLKRREGERTRKAEYRARTAPERDAAEPSDGPMGQRDLSRGTSTVVPQEMALTGTKTETGTRTGTGKPPIVAIAGNDTAAAAVTHEADDWPTGDATMCAQLLVAEAGSHRLDPARSLGLATTATRLDAWRRQGASWSYDVLPIVTTLARRTGPLISTWKFFDAAVAQSIADNRQALEIP